MTVSIDGFLVGIMVRDCYIVARAWIYEERPAVVQSEDEIPTFFARCI